MTLPYLNLDYQVDEDLVNNWWNDFTVKFGHTGYGRTNGVNNTKIITELYGHENFIKDDIDALELKARVNNYAESILKDLNLENVEYHVTFMVTNQGILDWHIDEASPTRSGCSGAIMFSLNEDKRAPTEWIYNDVYYMLDGYKTALINCSCKHRVDNSEHTKRKTFRIALYGITFEEIKNRILGSEYASTNTK